MSIYGAMRTSVAGMAVQADRIGAVADNVANASTTGYKRVGTEFETMVVANAVAGEYTSGSVQSRVQRSVGEQGALDYTAQPTDLAINGSGFFIVAGPSDETALTRAGAFRVDGAGQLVNAAGYKLLGYDITAGEPAIVANGTAGLVPISPPDLDMRAVPSAAGNLAVNLPPAAAVVAPSALPSGNGAGASYTAKTSLVAYDNLGTAQLLDVYFAKSDQNEWDVAVFDRADAPASGEFPYAGAALATGVLAFDAADGKIDAGRIGALDVPIPGGGTMRLDLSGSTQVAADFIVKRASVDGSAPVGVERLDIDASGLVSAIYKNGTRADVYRIPVATVPSPDRLSAIAGNAFAINSDSGDFVVSRAGLGGAGALVSGALEQSNVDLADELTLMIQSQRSYSANSKVFQAGAELMDVLVNLRT